MQNIKYHLSPSPMGYTKATNYGIKEARGQYIILLNNDTKLLVQNKNEWINILEKPFIESPKCAISGPLKILENNINRNFIVFFCAMIKKDVFYKIGLLDEIFNPGGAEDCDFCIKAENCGFEIVQVPEEKCLTSDGGYVNGKFPIYHFGEGTMHDNYLMPNWNGTLTKNFKIISKRYGEKKDIKNKVAIIMPSYNSEKFIKKSIDAIVEQNYKNWILVIVDDCSSDNTSVVCKKLTLDDKRIIFFPKDKNEGPSSARNIGLKITENFITDVSYIAFCDSDDIWKSSHLENSLKFFANNNADIVFSDVSPIFENGQQASSFGISHHNSASVETLTKGNHIYISSVVMKKECLRTVDLFDVSLDSIEDWDYWLSCAEKGLKICHNDVKDVIYTVRESGLASKNNYEKMKIFREKHPFIDVQKIDTPKIKMSVPKLSTDKIKLNIGCGDVILPEYINCDLYSEKADIKFDAKQLPFDDNSVDEIYASHLIEHFDIIEAPLILKEWFRALKYGGKIVIETPDLLNTCKWFLASDEQWRIALYGHFFAWPWISGQQHKFLYTEIELRKSLSSAGFSNITRIPPDSIYVQKGHEEAYLKMEAIKELSNVK